MKINLATTITPPRKFAFDRNGRVRHVARHLGVKLPTVKGRKPHPVGDIRKDRAASDAFMRAISEHVDRNAFRHAIEAVLDLAGEYCARLTDEERQHVARIAVQAFTGKAVAK